MLLIDKLINIVPLKSATAIMHVKKNGFYVQGHFRSAGNAWCINSRGFWTSRCSFDTHGIDPRV